jgi:hypothetical protein
MLLDLKKHKFQVILTLTLGFLFYFKTKNERNSAILIIALNIFFRAIKFDDLFNKYLNLNEKFINFESKDEVSAFTKTIGKAVKFCKDKKGRTCNRFLKSYKKMNGDLNKVLTKHKL